MLVRVFGFGKNKPRVDSSLARQAIAEVAHNERIAGNGGKNWPLLGVLAVAIAAIGLWLWVGNQQIEVTTEKALAPEKLTRAEALESPAEVEESPPGYWFDSQEQALAALVADAGADVTDERSSCAVLLREGLRCEPITADSWDDLLSFNRPAVLELVTPEKFRIYLALVGVRDGQALVRTRNEIIEQPLAGLGPLWRGKALFIWRPPAGYSEPIGLRDTGGAVEWLAQSFASLDQQSEPLSRDLFNEALRDRVRLFQHNNGLEEDGVAGLRTLLKLREQLGVAAQLQNPKPSQRGG